MTDVLPAEAGLTVGGVYYRYSVEKNEVDDFFVTLQNENAIDGGYTFRNTDDWSGLPGNTINRSVPVDNIPIEYWGLGSIVTSGEGEVYNTNVQYTYKYDTCFDPQTSPECPGYIKEQQSYLVNIAYDVNDVIDEYTKNMLNQKVDLDEEIKDEEGEEEEKEEEEKDLEDALKISGAANLIANKATQQSMLTALASIEKLNTYLDVTIEGGTYTETIEIKDTNIPDNRNAAVRMGLAQDKKHDDLVRLQYE